MRGFLCRKRMNAPQPSPLPSKDGKKPHGKGKENRKEKPITPQIKEPGIPTDDIWIIYILIVIYLLLLPL